MDAKENAERDSVESTALLSLLVDIRAAVCDPTESLTQDELVARCRKMRDTLLFIQYECDWETPRGDFGGGGDERIGPAIAAALNWPDKAALESTASAPASAPALVAGKDDMKDDLYKTRYKHRTPKIDYVLAAAIVIPLFLCILWLYAKAMQRHGLLP